MDHANEMVRYILSDKNNMLQTITHIRSSCDWYIVALNRIRYANQKKVKHFPKIQTPNHKTEMWKKKELSFICDRAQHTPNMYDRENVYHRPFGNVFRNEKQQFIAYLQIKWQQ